MKTSKVIVTGPEGSGTTMMTEVTARLLGWTHRTPSPTECDRPSDLEPEKVFHISLPSYRPCVWMPTSPVEGATIVMVIRKPNDAIYSAWKRFKNNLMVSDSSVGPDSLDDYNASLMKALTRMVLHRTNSESGFLTMYETFVDQPDEEIKELAKVLGVKPKTTKELGLDIRRDESGKYLKDEEYCRWLKSHATP